MKYLVLFDELKAKEARDLASSDISAFTIGPSFFWKPRFLWVIRRIDYVVVFGSSINRSKNVTWEVESLSHQVILIVVEDEKVKASVKFKANVFIVGSNFAIGKDIATLFDEIDHSDLISPTLTPEVAKDLMYKMLETSESLINRRQNTNTFMMTANSLLLTLIGVLFGLKGATGPKFTFIIISLIGILICLSWIRLLKSFGKLNGAKFRVIHRLEKIVGSSIFSAEWRFLTKKSISYKSFTKTEQLVPVLMVAVYAAIIVFLFLNLNLNSKEIEKTWHFISS